MPKMHYFSNKFSKIAKHWGLTAPGESSILMTWSYVIWLNCGFSRWLWRNRTSKISYNVIFVTSSTLRQPNDVTKITSKNFPFWAPSQSKFLATPVG